MPTIISLLSMECTINKYIVVFLVIVQKVIAHPYEVRIGNHTHSKQPQRACQRHQHAGSNHSARPSTHCHTVAPGVVTYKNVKYSY